MCKVDGIEVTREEWPAWDEAVASFQRTLHGHLTLIRSKANGSGHRQQFGDASDGLATLSALEGKP